MGGISYEGAGAHGATNDIGQVYDALQGLLKQHDQVITDARAAVASEQASHGGRTSGPSAADQVLHALDEIHQMGSHALGGAGDSTDNTHQNSGAAANSTEEQDRTGADSIRRAGRA